MDDAPEISKMLTLSTGHLTEEACNTYLATVISYPKSEYGWFIYVNTADELEDPPLSLLDCIGFAEEHGCDWIMFDCDGPIMEGLTTYEW